MVPCRLLGLVKASTILCRCEIYEEQCQPVRENDIWDLLFIFFKEKRDKFYFYVFPTPSLGNMKNIFTIVFYDYKAHYYYKENINPKCIFVNITEKHIPAMLTTQKKIKLLELLINSSDNSPPIPPENSFCNITLEKGTVYLVAFRCTYAFYIS